MGMEFEINWNGNVIIRWEREGMRALTVIPLTFKLTLFPVVFDLTRVN